MLWAPGRGRHRGRGRGRLARPTAAGVRPGDVLLAIDGAAGRDAGRRRRAAQHAADAGTRLIYTLLRLGTREVLQMSARADPDGQARALLRPRRGRHLHAARRRRGAAAPSARSGDAALLLAVRRVLRRRSRSRSTAASIGSTGSSTGATRSSIAAAAAAVPALHAGVSRAAARLAAVADRAVALLPLLYLPALRARRRARRRRSRAAPPTAPLFSRVLGPLDRLELALPVRRALVGGLVVLVRAFARGRAR